jgi:hypothetical protein
MELRVGEFGIADFFNLTNHGSDSNFQFLNWTVDNNETYDYAGDTRGYTFTAVLEYHTLMARYGSPKPSCPKLPTGFIWMLILLVRARRISTLSYADRSYRTSKVSCDYFPM